MTILPQDRNRRVLVSLLGVVVVMGALSWAAVPFYSWFCRVTGYGGTTQVGAGTGQVLGEMVTVRFDANTDPGLPWEFRPMQREMTLRIGETGMAFYEAINTSSRPITGRASYNVAPEIAGAYFYKIQCFCFTEQTLAPGERVEMPVVFEVDPGIVADRDAGKVRDITLSYTFYQDDAPAGAVSETQAALLPGPGASKVN